MPNFWSRTKHAVDNAYNNVKDNVAKKYYHMKSKAKRKATSLTKRAYNAAKNNAIRFKDYGVAKAKSIVRRAKNSAIVKTLQMRIFNAGAHFMDSIVTSKYDSVGKAAKRLLDLKHELAEVLDDKDTFLKENRIIDELTSTYGERRSSTPSSSSTSHGTPSKIFL